ncbi:SDR family oxidoreductase [Chryseobacterium luteum]|uniref:Short-chain dehydrogenase n=1 Tax=Chryseobacterium luteum TaxID=421531 RepID=A0A085ZBN5_9FLAO|nr:SDR family oxidoreductase [Chryseobacterium luteum]KFF01849.1 hypothetical protein IX38_15240 [Chryseobacterium luteum]
MIDLIYASFRQNLNNTNIFNNRGLNAEQIENAVHDIIPSIPFKRQSEAAEIANAVLFLASEKASYIPGAEIKVVQEFQS